MKKVLVLLMVLVSFQGFAQEGVSADAAADANNPLSTAIALNFQDYYIPLVSGSDASLNTFFLRYAQPLAKGRILIRASIPVTSTVLKVPDQSSTGLGNTNIFATYSFISNSTTTLGVGPFMLFPGTGGKGSDAWQVGAALIGFFIPSKEFQWGGLVTWQIDVAGSDDANMLVTQPFCMFQLGNGLYLRSSGIWTFDFISGNINIPLGLGIGKVFGSNPAITYNAFIEPQFSVYNRGDGNPNFQLLFGFNNQFRMGAK